MAKDPNQRELRCPVCGREVTRRLADHDEYDCPECASAFTVLLEDNSGEIAFFDRAATTTPEPLNLPRGSIRALITLMMALACWTLIVTGRDVPGSLLSLLLTTMGFYFGFRNKAAMLSDRVYDPAAKREQPLHLPAGVIRNVLIIGFAVAGFVLWSRGQGGEPKFVEFFFVLGGLIAGHVSRRLLAAIKTDGRQVVSGHVRGVLGLLVSAVLTVCFLTGFYENLDERWISLLCAAVSFYFGSRQ